MTQLIEKPQTRREAGINDTHEKFFTIFEIANAPQIRTVTGRQYDEKWRASKDYAWDAGREPRIMADVAADLYRFSSRMQYGISEEALDSYQQYVRERFPTSEEMRAMANEETLPFLQAVYGDTVSDNPQLDLEGVELDENQRTLPLHDEGASYEPSDEETKPRDRNISRKLLPALRRLLDEYDPDGRITIEPMFMGSKRMGDHFRVNLYDTNSELQAVIADSEKVGNALFVWRPDKSEKGVDEVFGGTKQDAVRMGAQRIIHPANFHALTPEEQDAFYEGSVLDALTN